MNFKKNINLTAIESNLNYHELYLELFSIRYNFQLFKDFSSFKDFLDSGNSDPNLLLTDESIRTGDHYQFVSDNKIPFVVISENNKIEDIRYYFNQGAIDYILRPFVASEIIVKVEQALIAQNHLPAIPIIYEDEMTQNLEHLTNKERKILQYFIDRKGQVVERTEIISHIWKEINIHPKTVDVHVHNLKKKLTQSCFNIISHGQGRWNIVGQA